MIRIVRLAWCGACLLLGLASPAVAESMSETIARGRAVIAREDAALAPGRVEPIWLADGRAFVFLGDATGALAVSLVDPAGGPTRLLRDSDVRKAFASLEGGEPLDGYGLAGLTDDRRAVVFVRDARSVEIDTKTLAARRLDAAESSADSGPRTIRSQFPTTFPPLIEAASRDGKRFVTLVDSDLWLRAPGSPLRRLTDDGRPDHGWANADESAGGFNVIWAPDNRTIAAIKLDTRGVYQLPVVHWLGPHEVIERLTFPRAGEAMPRFEIQLIDVDGGARVEVATGDTRDHFVNLVGWSSNGDELYYATYDREQKHYALWAASRRTGAVRKVLSQASSTYLSTPLVDGADPVTLLRQSADLVVLSDETGWRQIYRYSPQGERLRQLTTAAYPVEQIVRVDEAAAWIYYLAPSRPQRPYDQQLFRVSLRGGRPELLSGAPGRHHIRFSPSGGFYLDTYSSPTLPPRVEYRRADGVLVARVSAVAEGALAALGVGGMEEFSNRSRDGKWLQYGVIVKPNHFNPDARYPVVEIIYGGMHRNHVPNEYYAGPNYFRIARLLASQGFVVVYMNAPGTPERGREFQMATYGTWPRGVIANHVAWISDAAKSRPYMDLSRVGVLGNSWGGYMTVRALIDAPDFYKAGVAMAPVADFEDHPMFIEPFMGLPRNNPDGYRAGSNLARVDRITGDLLVMPEPLDVNAPYSAGMKLVDAMVRRQKAVEVFSIPEVNHHVDCCGPDIEAYAHAVVTRFLARRLLAPSTGPEAPRTTP